jgi:hypothetical protein
VFTRLRSHKKAQRLELLYFSFYMVEENVHEREIETLLIRGASHLLSFNEKKNASAFRPAASMTTSPELPFTNDTIRRARKRNGVDSLLSSGYTGKNTSHQCSASESLPIQKLLGCGAKTANFILNRNPIRARRQQAAQLRV